ncbi:DUF92 domain-containing protein [Pedobacter gandavensis]|uniref:DUF92 domain-containing protein n=1 Tax=Pedobacter gandavensis TaxID=2679963 RepID=A0ABR6EUF5_9SPHI|nr:DUF92 domain-containing protein [Pedobacter gandavensis]MBB2148905.1 DUF92 domain-containing protein [Pedobacter gandavensis]
MPPILTDPFLQIVLILLMVVMVVCVKIGKLTRYAALTAAVLGFLVASAAGLKGISLLGVFFVLSVLATSHKKAVKRLINKDSGEKQGRDAWQVLANGGVAGLTAILSLLNPAHQDLYLLMMAASLASALADTLSSELGMVYGKRFYNIITFKREANGLDGVISLEGSIIGAIGAGIIALIYAGFGQLALIVIIAGIIGNLTDSLLGGLLERKHLIGNNMVNFLNTGFAAIVGLILALVFHIF